MASNAKRAAASRRVWGCIRQVLEPDEVIEMRNDPLGDRYAVNKFGIITEHESLDRLGEIQDGAIGMLRLQGYEVEQGHSMVVLTNKDGVRVVINRIEDLSAIGKVGGLFRVGVH